MCGCLYLLRGSSPVLTQNHNALFPIPFFSTYKDVVNAMGFKTELSMHIYHRYIFQIPDSR